MEPTAEGSSETEREPKGQGGRPCPFQLQPVWSVGFLSRDLAARAPEPLGVGRMISCVTPSVVSITGGVELTPLASMAQVVGFGELANGHV